METGVLYIAASRPFPTDGIFETRSDGQADARNGEIAGHLAVSSTASR